MLLVVSLLSTFSKAGCEIIIFLLIVTAVDLSWLYLSTLGEHDIRELA